MKMKREFRRFVRVSKIGTVAAAALLQGLASAVAAQGANGSNSQGMLVIANSNDTQHRDGEGYLTLMNGTTGEILGKIPNGGVTGHEVLVSHDGRTAYVPIYSNGVVGGKGTDERDINVFDLTTRKQIGAVHFEQGVRPHFAVWGPDGNIYVTNEIAQRIAIVNPKTLQVMATIPTGAASSHNLAVSHDGKNVYTSNVFAGTISVLDVKDRKLVTQIPVATPEKHQATNQRHWQLQRVAVSPDDRYVLTCDWDNNDFVAIDRKTNTVAHRVKLPNGCYGADFLDGGKTAVVPIEFSSQVAVIDMTTWQVKRLVDVPKGPQETLVRPDGKMIYVSSAYADKVEFLDPATWTVTKVVDTGYFPDGIAWARQPENAKPASAAK